MGFFKRHPPPKKRNKKQNDAHLTEVFPLVPDGITFESTYLKVYTEDSDIYQRINDSKTRRMFHRSVCRWISKFITGCAHFKDAARQVCPATVTTNNYIVKTRQFLQKDAKYTVSQLVRMEF